MSWRHSIGPLASSDRFPLPPRSVSRPTGGCPRVCRAKRLRAVGYDHPLRMDGHVVVGERCSANKNCARTSSSARARAKGRLQLFEKLLPETQYVGEVGLDGAPEFRKHWADQQEVFMRILASCQSVGGRVLSVHSRRAATAVLDAIQTAPGAGLPILHWFSGTARELARALELGCWFSVGPAMLGSEKGRQLVAKMPRGRVLTESDGPFVTIGDKPALPWDLDATEAALAELWTESPEGVRVTLRENLQRLITTAPFSSSQP